MFKKVVEFLKEPKNINILKNIGIIILVFIFLRQCNNANSLKSQLEFEKIESKRLLNNSEVEKDSIRQSKFNDNTWRAEKSGYELTVKELKNQYSDLLGDFKLDKNKPPKSIIKIEYILKEVIRNVLVTAEFDENGSYLKVMDSINFNKSNYRVLSGSIPYTIEVNSLDSTYKIIPKPGMFTIQQGMNLNVGLFKDKKTNKISIIADTDYPGIKFTNIAGASIMDDPKNKKILIDARKSFGIGVQIGYGFQVDANNSKINTGPYIGFGISYCPKFLQWGK